MSKRVTIQGNVESFYGMRVLIDEDKWYVVEGEKKPCIECPNCGGGLLGDNAPHSIDENGNVNASVVCTHKGCEFHANIQLIGWNGGYIPKGPIKK